VGVIWTCDAPQSTKPRRSQAGHLIIGRVDMGEPLLHAAVHALISSRWHRARRGLSRVLVGRHAFRDHHIGQAARPRKGQPIASRFAAPSSRDWSRHSTGLDQIQPIEDAIYCDIQRKIRRKDALKQRCIEAMGTVMVEFTIPGVATNYTIALLLFLSCALLFICIKKDDELIRDRSSEERSTLDDHANTDTIDYENYAAQYIRAAQRCAALH
jgi:hypothetical protein